MNLLTYSYGKKVTKLEEKQFFERLTSNGKKPYPANAIDGASVFLHNLTPLIGRRYSDSNPNSPNIELSHQLRFAKSAKNRISFFERKINEL